MPRNELEQALVGIWSRGLGIDHIGIHDSFIALGGHSLLAIEMVAEISALSGIEIVVSDLMAAPTVAGMAEAIARTIAEKLDPETLAALARESDSPNPRRP